MVQLTSVKYAEKNQMDQIVTGLHQNFGRCFPVARVHTNVERATGPKMWMEDSTAADADPVSSAFLTGSGSGIRDKFFLDSLYLFNLTKKNFGQKYFISWSIYSNIFLYLLKKWNTVIYNYKKCMAPKKRYRVKQLIYFFPSLLDPGWKKISVRDKHPRYVTQEDSQLPWPRSRRGWGSNGGTSFSGNGMIVTSQNSHVNSLIMPRRA